jgi:hypothetical protein
LEVGVCAIFVFVIVNDFDVCVIARDSDSGIQKIQVRLRDDSEMFVILVIHVVLDVVMDCGVKVFVMFV